MNKMIVNIKVLHIIAWISYFIILLVFFSSTFNIGSALTQSTYTILIHIILFYFNSEILVPKLLDNKKYLIYAVSILLLIIVAIGIIHFLQTHFTILDQRMIRRRSLPPNFIGRDKSVNEFAFLLRSIFRNFSTIFAILLLSTVSKLLMNKIKTEQKSINIENEHLLSEMKFLKSQINPHFLFNSLNNIYSLVQSKEDIAPDMLLKLSRMLRYMLYECNDNFVTIDKEIQYINNYIALQQLKTEYSQQIQFNFIEVDSSTKIPPLLLIPFVENSFKHSNIEDINNGQVNIELSSTKTSIKFEIFNTIPEIKITKDKTGGIGLENVKRRLELYYSDKYDLDISKINNKFVVKLNIENNED